MWKVPSEALTSVWQTEAATMSMRRSFGPGSRYLIFSSLGPPVPRAT